MCVLVLLHHDQAPDTQRGLHRDWADDDEGDEGVVELPPPQTIQNKDGTKTTITYRLNENNQKVKTTRRIRLVTHREVVNPRVAERKTWAKFGLSEKDSIGPQHDTTSVGENIIFRLSTNWRKDTKDEAKDPNANAMKEQLKDKTVKCRICNGEHFTARCPYKDTMAPVGAEGGADVAAGMGDEAGAAQAGPAGKKGSYVPPALRGDRAGGATGDRMGGSKYGERDDLATLRVTNVSSLHRPPQYLQCATHLRYQWLTHGKNRSQRWQRRASFGICSSGLAALPVCFWPRIARLVSPRDSLSSVLRIGATPSRHARKWMVTVSSI